MIVSSTQAESDRQPLERQGARPRPNPRPWNLPGSLRAAFLAFLAFLAGLLAALAAAPAAAQTTITLVSNSGQADDTTASGTRDRAQRFTTGSNAAGYTLASIEIVSEDPESDDDALAIWTVTASGFPDAVHASLTAPIGFAAGTLVFTAPASTELAANTTYALLIQTPGGETLSLDSTTSNNEDAGGAAGWSIADAYEFKNAGGMWGTTGTGQSFRITVKGAAKTGTADTTAPAFESAAADGASLVITFDEDLAAAASLANSAFTVKKTASGGSEATVALSTTVAPVISGTTVTLTLGTALVSTDGSVKVTYTKPTTGSANKLVDAASNETATFTDQTVTNNTTTATAPVAAAAPTVAAVSGSTRSLAVSWIAPADGGSAITSYDVQYREGTSGLFTDGPQDVTGTSLTISGLTQNTSYQVQVRATNAEGDSDWSASGSGTTNADTTPPALVSAYVISSGAEIDLQMSENLLLSNLPPASAFTVTVGGSAVSVTAVGRGGTSFQNDTAKITVSPVVRAGQAVVVAYADPTAGDDANAIQDAPGNDTPDFTTGSGGVVAVLNLSTITATAPAAPTAPTVAGVSGSTTSLTVSWSAPADNGSAITTYDVQYRPGTSGDFTNGPQDVGVTSATITGLAANSPYQVQVRATNAEGDSDWSPSGSGTTNAVQTATAPAAPTAPTVAAVSGSSTSLAVSWSAPADNGSAITSYDLQYREGTTGNFADGPQNVNGTSVTITDLAANSPYQVQVRATNAEGDSDWSASGSGTTNAGTTGTDLVVIGFRGVSVPEGVVGQLSFPEDVGTAVLTAYLDRSSETALSVPWSTSDHTAVSPDDYTGGEGTLTFAPGETEQTIALPIVDDAIREDSDPVFGEDESFLVALEFGDDYRLKNSGLVRVLILDNDGDGPVTRDTRPPLLTQVTVNGSTLVLTYNEALDGGSVPAAGAFVVTADGSAITVNGVSVAGSTVTLTLATAVEAGQTVTLAYTPDTNPIQDAAASPALEIPAPEIER